MRTVAERIEVLRGEMCRRDLSHYWIPSADEHLSEYVPAWRQRRAWMSGFTGSAGDLLVGLTAEDTWLFTDGRYHLQAEQELAGGGIGLQRVGAARAKTPVQLLRKLVGERGAACVVGTDPMVLPCSLGEEFTRVLEGGGGRLQPVAPNLVDSLWRERPCPPGGPLLPAPSGAGGRSVADKLRQLREGLAEKQATATVVVKLDQIAWLTNLRATDDIAFNPVFEAFLYVDPDAVHLFLHRGEQRLPAGYARDVANAVGLRVHGYESFANFLKESARGRVLLDAERTTAGVLAALEANPAVAVVRGSSPLEEAKAIKDPAESTAMERANLLASVAKTRALLWLRRQLAAEAEVTERSFADWLERAYREQPGFLQLSFPTIAAIGEHGAVVHYGAVDQTPLRAGELFLVDSGMHAAGGTTDATRTVVVGDAAAEQREIYTLVLKGHIAAARQLFHQGSAGAALDALARAPLWQTRRNYAHGTGHGVGALLNVHEGPFALSEARRPGAPGYGLKAGMVTSIEPGYYAPGFGGVRLEGLYRLVEAGTHDGSTWLRCEPLTWIPFDLRLVEDELLTPEESAWLGEYHRGCVEKLAPHLARAERQQLRDELLPG